MRSVLVFLFLFLSAVRSCFAEEITLEIKNQNLEKNSVVEINSYGFTSLRYKLRPVSNDFLLEIFNPEKSIWVNAGASWSELPYLQDSNQVKIRNEDPGSGVISFRFLDMADNKIYETNPVVFYSQDETLSLSRSFMSLAGKLEADYAPDPTSGSSREQELILHSKPPGQSNTWDGGLFLSGNRAIILIGIITGVVVLAVYVRREKNVLLDDKIQ